MDIFVEDGYVASYALEGHIVGGITIDEPDDLELFLSCPTAFRYIDGMLEFDPERKTLYENTTMLDELRFMREHICFPIINRGALWYDQLTAQQEIELSQWYQDWLDVTITKEIPTTPEWIK